MIASGKLSHQHLVRSPLVLASDWPKLRSWKNLFFLTLTLVALFSMKFAGKVASQLISINLFGAMAGINGEARIFDRRG
jgi:hypothetical protein